MSNLTTCPCCTDGFVLCRRCDGEGHFLDEGPAHACAACYGTGHQDCPTCAGFGTLTPGELAELAEETEDPQLLALVAERDPQMTPEQRLREMGFEPVEEVQNAA